MDLQFEEIFVDVPWGKVSVLCCGNKDDPPVVMLHGNQDSAATYFPLLKYFPKNLRIILPELPGCGKSSAFPPGQMIHCMDFVSPLRMVVQHFQLTNFTYIGHSMGGQIGLLYESIYSGDIVRLIILDHVSYPPVEPHNFNLWYKLIFERFFNPINYKKLTAGPDYNPHYTYEEALAIVMKNRGLTKDAGETVLSRGLVPTEDGLYRFCWDQRLKVNCNPAFGLDYLLKLYGRISIPYLTILASESIKRIHPTIDAHSPLIETLIENNPRYRVVMVEGNHDVHLNTPERVAAHVVPFLMGHEPDRLESIELIVQLKNTLKAQRNKNAKSKL